MIEIDTAPRDVVGVARADDVEDGDTIFVFGGCALGIGITSLKIGSKKARCKTASCLYWPCANDHPVYFLRASLAASGALSMVPDIVYGSNRSIHFCT